MLLEFTLMNNTDFNSELNNTSIAGKATSQKLPGDIAMWFFILVELTVFAIFFMGFAITENMNIAMFVDGKDKLHKTAGLINTVALITSSFFVALSLLSLQKNREKQAVTFLFSALTFALVYIVVKLWEYQALFNQGIDIETNTFFTLYFLITAFHFMHILLGMVILTYMLISTLKGRYSRNEDISGFESGACYWHMVDLLWIILFPLIYII